MGHLFRRRLQLQPLDKGTTPIPEPDVCIIGAGPAGLTAALTLGQAGRTVLLLDSGSYSGSRAIQKHNDGDHEGEPYVGLVASRHRQVGGTPNIWDVPVQSQIGAKYVPLSEPDLEHWPVDLAELMPYYLQAQKLCGLGPFEYEAGFWATPERRPFDLDGTALISSVYQYGTQTQFTLKLPHQLQQTGGVRLMPATTVVGLATHGAARFATVTAVGENGEAFSIRPKAVVLACGAIENARLLLLGRFGSNSSWLGQGFMEHPRDFSVSMIPNSPDLVTTSAFYDQYESRNGHVVSGRLSLSDEVLKGHRVPNASLLLYPRLRPDRSFLARVKRSVWGPRFSSASRYGWSAESIDPSQLADFKVIVEAEQRPNRANRIVLSSRTDRFGNRLPHLVLKWTEEDQAQFERLRELIDESFRLARLGRLEYETGRHPNLSAHHHAGTTRMAASPDAGVVDREGRVFRSENLFVAGASVFPTAGFANPTLTIVALAIRLASHIDRTVL